MAYKDLAKRRAYYATHKDKINEVCRASYPENGVIERHRAYRLSHLSKYAEYQRNTNHRTKLEVLTHYSIGMYPMCAHCGEEDIDVLCIDHINNGGTAHQRSIRKLDGSTLQFWLKRNDYPEGYQVLCANCNLKKEILRRRRKYESD